MQGTNQPEIVEVVDITREGSQWKLQCGKVLSMAREAVDFRVRAVCNINALCAGGNCDSMSCSKLSDPVSFAAKSQVVPGSLERFCTLDYCCEYVIEVGITSGNIIQAAKLFNIGRYEVTSPEKVLCGCGMTQILCARRC